MRTYGSAYLLPRLSVLGCLTSLTYPFLLCLLLTSARRSEGIAPLSVSTRPTPYRPPGVRLHDLPRVDAGFTKHTQTVDMGLRGHVPARPGCTTPQIRFLYIVPCFRLGLPLHSTSRQRSSPSASLRLLLYLARRLSLRKLRAMPGTHVVNQHLARQRQYAGFILLCAGHGPAACWCAPRAYQLSNSRQA